VRENAITDMANLDAVPAHLKGVTCYFCHNAVSVGPEHYNGMVTLANDNVMRGGISNPIEPTTHKVAFSPLHAGTTPESSDLCGTCHDIVTPLGVHLERTFKEYTDSIFAAGGVSPSSCNSCHMNILPGGNQQAALQTGRPGQITLARGFHEHLWPAVDVALTDWPHADAMRSAINACQLPDSLSYVTLTRDPGPLGQFTVALETKAGHNFPSGATQDRRLWVELIAYDENKQELYRIGHIEDQAVEEATKQQHPCMFREYLEDQNGNETHDFWEAFAPDGLPEGKQMPVAPKGSSALVTHTAECAGLRPPLMFASMAPAFVDI
jgi:hypothetical protein